MLFLSTVFINVLSDFSLLPQICLLHSRIQNIPSQPGSRQHTETEAQQAAAVGAPPCSHSLRSLHSCRAQPCPRGGRGLFGTIFGIFKATSIISPFKTPSLAPFLLKECGQHRLCRQWKKLFVMLCLTQNIVKSERVGSHFLQPLTKWTCDWELTLSVGV